MAIYILESKLSSSVDKPMTTCGVRIDNFHTVGTGCTDPATHFQIMPDVEASAAPYDGGAGAQWGGIIDAGRRDDLQVAVNRDRSRVCCASGEGVRPKMVEKCDGEEVDRWRCL